MKPASGKGLNIIKKTALRCARTKFCKSAIDEKADLKAMRHKPTTKMMVGLGLIAFSYLIGLPAVIALGIIAVWTKEPLVAIVGGPLIYAISTIIFILGMKLAGTRYFHVITRWLVRIVLEKILGEDIHLLDGTSCPDEKTPSPDGI